jgi:hypothetical protein
MIFIGAISSFVQIPSPLAQFSKSVIAETITTIRGGSHVRPSSEALSLRRPEPIKKALAWHFGSTEQEEKID